MPFPMRFFIHLLVGSMCVAGGVSLGHLQYALLFLGILNLGFAHYEVVHRCGEK